MSAFKCDGKAFSLSKASMTSTRNLLRLILKIDYTQPRHRYYDISNISEIKIEEVKDYFKNDRANVKLEKSFEE
ncbi:hypothetical protein V1477_011742 [Vespula maculifrons]|uniref:Uncharacterized protein n=1 Tax=Vespula maculifrons TaxID=7453 RepID=A0ABD2C025_VESMC